MVINDLTREAWRVAAFYGRSWQRVVAGSASTAMWLLATVLAISWYGAVERYAVYIFWGFVSFTVFSDFAWAASEVRALAVAGVLEYVRAAKGNPFWAICGHVLATGLLWSVIDVSLLYAVYTALFGAPPPPAEPLLFVGSLATLTLFSLGVSVAASYTFVGSRTPWLGANIIMWVVPLTGGMIPPTLMPRDIAMAFAYSPPHYAIAPPIYAATGRWLVEPGLAMPIGIAVSLIAIVTAMYTWRRAYAAAARGAGPLAASP